MFGAIWDEVLFRPMYNLLIWLTTWVPGHNLGLAIVIMTIIVRIVLFFPTYSSLRQQKSLQQLQPKINATRAKHANDQQKQAEAIMALYKEHGVHPLGSCLPVLVQLPLLYAVFAVLQHVLDPNYTHFLYSGLSNFDISLIDVHFLSFDMTVADPWILPILTGATQFISMKMAQAKQKEKIRDITPKTSSEPSQMKDMEKATNSMIYLMPLLLAWFARSYPAGLAMYWIVSTVFSIGQQAVLNRRN
ncbi:YidC/Oxa1 family membrane protein insertase [Candidatus Gracilibacteria bacterium]|nr:YidC/Oxa1 family membrane protein insertase [Candidatus Gracilibacteria bacterium]